MPGTRWLSLRVERRTVEADGVVSLTLAAADGAPLPPWEPGAHIDLHLPGGRVRPYSLCGGPQDAGLYRLGVLLEPGGRGGSRWVHEHLREGARIHAAGPRNHFPLRGGASFSLLIAGGIGITPLLAMAERLAASGGDFELHYAARTAQRMAFRERLSTLASNGRVRMHADDGPAAQSLDLPGVLASPRIGACLYLCGPSGFMAAARREARAAGWPDDAVHAEAFSAAPLQAGAEHAFDVVLARSGRCIRVPAALSVAQALEAEGVVLPLSCQQGVCGTCLTGVLEGEVDHRDLFLSPDEQATHRQFLPCCSRAVSDRLILDL